MSQAVACRKRTIGLPVLGGKVFSAGEDRAWTFSSLVFGAIFGLSQPEFGLWFLAWIGLVPLILLSVSSRRMPQAAIRGFLFGTAFNLVALNWLLHVSPPWWVKVEATEMLQYLGVAAWVLAGLIQGSAYALFSSFIKFVSDSKRFASLKLMAVLPFLWVLVSHVLCNQPDLLLVPVSVLEYSQYRQSSIIQIASIVGGIGLELLIVAFNLALAAVIIAVAGRRGIFPGAAFVSREWAAACLAAVSCLVLVVTAWGWWRVESNQQGVSPARTHSQFFLMVERGGRDGRNSYLLGIDSLHDSAPALQ
jgi:apolipoprotein N-acyltransferase